MQQSPPSLLHSKIAAIWSIACAILIGWLLLTDNVTRGIAVPVLFLAWLGGIGLVWVALGRHQFLRRLGLLTLGTVIALGAIALLFRYDGSADGTARPKLTWRWSRSSSSLAAPDLNPAATPSNISNPPGAANWLRFMGPQGDGILPQRSWSTDWNQNPPEEIWRLPIGGGWGGFAVCDGRAITLEQRDQMECVICYDLASGSILWSHQIEARFEEALGGIGPRSTPTIHPESQAVYTLGATGQLHCLDLQTGVSRWTRDILQDSNTNLMTYGLSASPLVHGNQVIITAGEGKKGIIAYHKEDGSILWSTAGGGGYSSPVLLELAAKPTLVINSAKQVSGLHPETGQPLWTFPWPGAFPKVGQPILTAPDTLLVTAGYGMKSHLFQIQPGQPEATTLWSSSAPRTKFSSAVTIAGHAYAMDEGTLCCVRLSDGTKLWRQGRYGFGQQLLCGQDILLIQAESGEIVLVQPDPEKLIELTRLKALSSKTWNPPTLAGNWLLARNDREAVCYKLPPSAP